MSKSHEEDHRPFQLVRTLEFPDQRQAALAGEISVTRGSELDDLLLGSHWRSATSSGPGLESTWLELIADDCVILESLITIQR
jgi:hypothetical protein